MNNFSKKKRSTEFGFAFLAFCFDLVAFASTFLIIWWLRIGMWSNLEPTVYWWALLVGVSTYSFIAIGENIYEPARLKDASNSIFTAFKVSFFVFGTMLLLAFMLKVTNEFSRVWAFSWAGSFLAYLVASRLSFTRILKKLAQKGVLLPKAVIIGDVSTALELLARLEKKSKSAVHVVGYVSPQKSHQKNLNSKLNCLGCINDISAIVTMYDIEQAFITVDNRNVDLVNDIYDQVRSLALDVFLAPQHFRKMPESCQLEEIQGDHYLLIAQRPIGRWKAVTKRLEDIVLTSLGLLLIWPLMLLVAIAIKVETRGPVLFRQKRCGFNGVSFEILKFRSMVHDSYKNGAFKQAVKSDPRITRVGKIIRKTSIDELPQLFNVLKGDMSLVGPRPHARETRAEGKLFEEIVSIYSERHRVKPGVTGWAQVNGWRGETDTEEKIRKRVEYDLYYINNWSLLFDIKIILKTVLVVLFDNQNAY